MAKLYLHQDPEFNILINIIAKKMDIDPSLVEKDYWIMHCLYGLQKANKEFYLKGGTSLSKGFQVIDRFSEDIDILIKPSNKQEVKTGKNQNKPAHIQSRKDFYDTLSKQLEIDGIHTIERDKEFDDKTGKYRSGGIRLLYDTTTETPEDIKEGILLEAGFDKIDPFREITISSWAFDYAKEQGLSYIDNRAIDVPCYLPGYTFVEKLHAINKKYSQQQSGKGFEANFMRHYYDLFKLLELEEVLNFIGTHDYLEHKKSRFKQETLNQAITLEDTVAFSKYADRYEKSKTLYYREKPSFHEIIERLRVHHPSF